jgi:hypothetical protein
MEYKIVEGFEQISVIRELSIRGIATVLKLSDPPPKTIPGPQLTKNFRYATVIVFSSEDIKNTVLEALPELQLIRHHVLQVENPSASARIMEFACREAVSIINRKKEYIKRISENRSFDAKFAYPWIHGRRKIYTEYLNGWRTGISPRKPFPGFHPGIYTDRSGLKDWMENGDPLVHYIDSGRPIGPWLSKTIVPGIFCRRRKSELKTALHIHLYYEDLTEDLIRRIARSASRPDIYISVSSEDLGNRIHRKFLRLSDHHITVRVVPNIGRDLAPFFNTFSSELKSYDVIGHVHAKKSIGYSNRILIQHWINFLFENMIGGRKPMIDVILEAMQSDEELGLVYPEDPNVIGWMGNLDHAKSLMGRMGFGDAPLGKHLNFPIGSMFWVRPKAIQPLFDLNLGLNDFPPEPIPADGTLLHALERLLPVVSELSGYRNATTFVKGVLR